MKMQLAERVFSEEVLDFARFIHTQAHVLSLYPELTLQQAANEPKESAPARAISSRLSPKEADRYWIKWVNKPQISLNLVIIFNGHSDWVTACWYSPDGRRIASGSSDNTVRLWDAQSGKEITTLRKHSNLVNACGYSPDGRRIVSSSWDKTIRVWDAESGKQIVMLEGHSDSVTACGYSPDGRRIVSGSHDGTVRVWDAATGEGLALFPANGAIGAVAVGGAGKSVTAGSADGKLYVLQLMSVEIGPPIVTSMYLYRFNQMKWDSKLTAKCEWCGKRFKPNARILDTISAIARIARLSPDQSPCASLPTEAFDEPRLLSTCPLCHKPLKFNPFLVDNRERFR